MPRPSQVLANIDTSLEAGVDHVTANVAGGRGWHLLGRYFFALIGNGPTLFCSI